MTNGVRVLGSRPFRLSVPQRIMLLTASVAAVAVALFVIVVRPLPGAPTALSLPWVLWAAAFAASELLVIHVQWRREANTFSMGDLGLTWNNTWLHKFDVKTPTATGNQIEQRAGVETGSPSQGYPKWKSVGIVRGGRLTVLHNQPSTYASRSSFWLKATTTSSPSSGTQMKPLSGPAPIAARRAHGS